MLRTERGNLISRTTHAFASVKQNKTPSQSHMVYWALVKGFSI